MFNFDWESKPMLKYQIHDKVQPTMLQKRRTNLTISNVLQIRVNFPSGNIFFMNQGI